ncbi:uncharacterized protein F5891DRAFT_951456 [Suillus fuscotomentosus]|uniref:Uncharacterized protein n=1 Tax=Suillus fuscotomentosus TaxID=1912939 RepID=A0AAD4E776_9AGAM|nr:uncharacterized protein F5891DRAFT_951456 [Suillus fuscotomentosus]KAG1901013.1 hypothetical protein F5891DRAFT_951456 [Suillus fuscotomentosus]
MRTSTRRQSPAPADVITYRLNNKMMYVPPAESFDQAVTFARSAFEGDLTGIDKSRISFSLNVLANGKQSSVGISSAAWSKIMSHLAQYEIIDVHVQPVLKVSEAPPSYRSCGSTGDVEKEHHSSPHSSSHSSSPLHGLIPKRLFQRLGA